MLTSPIPSVKSVDREHLLKQQGKVIRFTGLSVSGKSTLANTLEIELHQQDKHTFLLDGDILRQGLNQDLGFTDLDRAENIRRVAEVAKLMVEAGLIVITAFISPFEKERLLAKKLVGSEKFYEIYVNTSLEVCESRDVKGLYKKARMGEICEFTGISSPHEAPSDPFLELDYGCSLAPMTLIEVLIDKLGLNFSTTHMAGNAKKTKKSGARGYLLQKSVAPRRR